MLEIANLRLRVFDNYNDTLIYQGSLLDIEIVNLDGKEVPYLVISGTAIHTGEKEWEPHTPEGVVFIYRLDRKKKLFERAYKHASFEIEL